MPMLTNKGDTNPLIRINQGLDLPPVFCFISIFIISNFIHSLGGVQTASRDKYLLIGEHFIFCGAVPLGCVFDHIIFSSKSK